MCEPATIAGIVMSGVSMFANAEAQDKQIDARNQVNLAERDKQQRLQAEADALNRANEKHFDPKKQNESVAEEATRRDNYVQSQIVGANMPSAPVGEGAPTTVKSDLGARMADALSYGRNMATSQAKLSAYGANQFNNNILLNRNRQGLGTLTDMSGRSSSLVGDEFLAANQAGGKERGLGDMFLMGGQNALQYGMTRPPTGFAAGLAGAGAGGFG